MVKRQAVPSLSSFQSVGIDTSMVVVDKNTSMRSIESLSSNTSSLCSTDPAMRRTTSRQRSGCVCKEKLASEGRTIDESQEMNCDLRVTFSPIVSDVVCEVINREDFTDNDRHELFLTLDDMSKIKNDAKYVTKYYRIKENSTVESLDNVYTEAMCRSTYFATYDEFLNFIRNGDGEFEKIAQQLNPWCRTVKISGRGLERYCSQKQRRERQAFSAECRAAVVRLSKSSTVTAEELSAFYHEYSRGNTIYARLMGRGDEIAAVNIFNKEVEARPTNLRNCAQQVAYDHCSEQWDRNDGMEGVTSNKLSDQIASIRENNKPFPEGFKKPDKLHHMDASSSKLLSMDRRQIFAMQRQSSSAKLIVRLSNRSLETL
jgi:hypothetical protein